MADANPNAPQNLEPRPPAQADLVALCRKLKPGKVAQYTVVRVGDEFIVDLMKSACVIEYAEAARGEKPPKVS